MSVETGRVIAACFALAAFAVAIVSGLTSGSATAQILLRAVVAMILCYPVGLVAGMVCERIIRAHLESQRAAEAPSNESSSPASATPASSSGQEGAPAAGRSAAGTPVVDPSRDQFAGAASAPDGRNRAAA